LKIGQYLTKLCVDYVGLLFLAHPVYDNMRKRNFFDFLSTTLFIFSAIKTQ